MLRPLGSHLWSQIRPVTGQQRFLFLVGTILLASALLHGGIAVVALITGQEWSGPVSWRKPVVFAASFGLLSLTAAWILRLLPRTRWLWIPASMLGTFSFIEVGVITLQKWRGVPSHFNTATDLDATLFGIMALSVLMVVLSLAILLIWVVAKFRGNGAERLATIVGLVGLLAAGYIGNNMIGAGEAHLSTSGEIPYEVIFGAAGSAKLAHFVGMHLIQFLAVLAIVAPERHRLPLVALGSLGGFALFASVTVTAYGGESWLAPSPAVGLLGVIGAVLAFAALALSVRSSSAGVTTPTISTPTPVA